jgi:hypothetical protein
MAQLIATFTHTTLCSQDAIHCGDRAEVLAFIKQSGPYLARRVIGEALRCEQIKDRLPFEG